MTSSRLSALQQWWNTAVFLTPMEESVYVTSLRGGVLQIPSRILVSDPDYKVIAYGAQAREVEYAGTQKTKILLPFTSLSISDEVAARLLLRAIIWEALGTRFLLKPSVHVVLAPHTSPFMRELWQRALFGAGARHVQAWHPALAAAAAAGLPYTSSHGYVVGWSDSENIFLCLLAFGQVQVEYVHSRRWQQNSTPSPEELSLVWREFLQKTPAEFITSFTQDGIIWITEEAPRGQSRAWAQVLQTPVTFFSWSNIPLGLRSIVQGEQ